MLDSTTQNGAPSHSTTGNPMVDLFAIIGAIRALPESETIKLFQRAYEYNPLDAVRLLFHTRDIRGGKGERKVFRTCLRWLAENDPVVVTKVLGWVPEYGRWDDLFCLGGTEVEIAALVTFIRGLEAGNALAAKWAPREGSAQHSTALKLMRLLGLRPKQYRGLITSLTKVVETQMCAGRWDQIDYSHVPSQAMRLYRKAFPKRDPARFAEFLGRVESGEVKIKAATLFPSDLVRTVLHQENKVSDLQWAALPNYISDSAYRVLVCADVSGSMTGTPMEVAVGLALYTAERLTGPFANTWMSFSAAPQLERVDPTQTLHRRVRQAMSRPACNTNLQAVFEQILRVAIENETPSVDLPNIVIVVSDMEFNDPSVGGLSNHKAIQAKYEACGYALPQLVYWNVSGRDTNFQVRFDQSRAALVSGYSPSILAQVLNGDMRCMSPEGVMRRVLDSPRYAGIEI